MHFTVEGGGAMAIEMKLENLWPLKFFPTHFIGILADFTTNMIHLPQCMPAEMLFESLQGSVLPFLRAENAFIEHVGVFDEMGCEALFGHKEGTTYRTTISVNLHKAHFLFAMCHSFSLYVGLQ